MSQVNIIKGSIKNIVDEEQFERLYKPNGWRIDDTIQAKNPKSEIPLNLLNTETEVRNYINMTKKQPKHFDDGLFFSDVNL